MEREGFLQQLAEDSHSRCSVSLDEELTTIVGKVAIIQNNPEPSLYVLGMESSEGKGKVEVANREIDRTAQGRAAEECIAHDSVAREPVLQPSLESDARYMGEVAQEVAYDGEFLACLDLLERVFQAVDQDS